MSRSYIKGTSQPRTKSAVAVSAKFQTGGGKHGPNKRQRAKQDRRNAKADLRS